MFLILKILNTIPVIKKVDNSQEKRAKENISLHNKLSMCSFYSEVVVYWPIKRYSYVIMRDLLHLDLQAINIYQIIIM